jgi:hypothetical protein
LKYYHNIGILLYQFVLFCIIQATQKGGYDSGYEIKLVGMVVGMILNRTTPYKGVENG